MQKLLVLALFAILFPLRAALYAQADPFTLGPLPYAFNALEPYIDAQTMEIHYARHHSAYVSNLNRAIKGTRYETLPITDILMRSERAGDAIRNNAGGHYNHTLFWNILAMNKPFNPESEVGKAVMATFGSYDSLRTLMNNAGAARFGSGWAWLSLTPDRKLVVSSSPNQDNPIMDVSRVRGIPVLGIDVWEHAYYLKYQNKRGDYLGAIWNVVNWEAVNKNYIAALSDPLLKAIEKDAWAELKDFHGVMSATFHPAEEGNLKPIYTRAGEMTAKARALQAAPIPASFDTPAMRKEMDNLVAGAVALERLTMLRKKDDAAIVQSLTKLHDVFHNIQGLCND